MISSKRARQLQTGGKDPLVPVDNDKPTVLALREIAEGLVDVKILNERSSIEMNDIADELEAVQTKKDAEIVAATTTTINDSIEESSAEEPPTEE